MKAYELFDPRDGVTRKVVATKTRARLITRWNLYKPLRGKHTARCWEYQKAEY